MSIQLSFNETGVMLNFTSKDSLINRLLSRQKTHPINEDRRVDFAIGDLRAAAAEAEEDIHIETSQIRMGHKTLSMLSADAADVLGLPPLVDLTLRTDVTGLLGSPDFKLHYEWIRAGRRELAQRTGAILQTSGKQANGLRRLPKWIFEGLNVADNFDGGSKYADHWTALAAFRRALEPGVSMDHRDPNGRVALSDFLDGLEVKLVDRFSISPRGNDQFDIIPFSADGIERITLGEEPVSEAAAELQGAALSTFQDRVYTRGARSAYKLSNQKYLVIDPGAGPALRVLANMKTHQNRAHREAFIRNPRQAITEAYTEELRQTGKLEGLSSAGEEELIERAAGPIFIETLEYSKRVTGITIFEAPQLDFDQSKTTWLPEAFSESVARTLENLEAAEIQGLISQIETAQQHGLESIEHKGQIIPATEVSRAALALRVEQIESEHRDEATGSEFAPVKKETVRPIILDHKSNLGDKVSYLADIRPRKPNISAVLPGIIRTQLKQHQVDCFHWMLEAWQAGLSGILSADEQGLGKTLQAIAFLAWMKEHWAASTGVATGPVLIVAPTSLLENWEQEVDKHLSPPGLGNVIRLYGSGIGSRKPPGQRGYDTQSGNAVLDFRDLQEAIMEGRGHRYWVLTTYSTLTNYQHSLGKIPFSTAVFDEIQALKNPGSLRAHAAATMNADMRIGLTGTPIENSTIDLWAIMDQLSPGWLGSLSEFRSRFGTADEGNMQDLYSLAFSSQNNLPPVALRRLKEDVARDLPPKTRRIHPRIMPAAQSEEYEKARIKLASGSRGGALKMLHHIRSVSVHPHAAANVPDRDYVNMSARLQAVMTVLQEIWRKNERVLVFIEHRLIQYRFIELVKREFELSRVDLINGQTPSTQRQKIVNRFQEHLTNGAGFDILVLSPKAAGVGLTLTAATHVIHLSRWWNPAVEEQCNDRVHRIGQQQAVTVHIPMAIHPDYQDSSFDCLLHSLMHQKRQLARSALWPMGDTNMDSDQLQQAVGQDKKVQTDDPLNAAMSAMFARDCVETPVANSDGSFPYD